MARLAAVARADPSSKHRHEGHRAVEFHPSENAGPPLPRRDYDHRANGNRIGRTWRGLTAAPEHRCAPYDKERDYPYPQSVEQEIARQLGTVYGPYTGTCFGSTRETDNEHIVAASEAHDSGLCAKDRETQARFARDLRNLLCRDTLSFSRINHHKLLYYLIFCSPFSSA